MGYELYNTEQLAAFERLKVTFGGWFPCPCCYRFGLSECPPGTFDICRCCGWEDDRVQFLNPDYPSGANRLSLVQARYNAALFGTKNLRPRRRQPLEAPRALPRIVSEYWVAPLTKASQGDTDRVAVKQLMNHYGVTPAMIQGFIAQNTWLLQDTNILYRR